MYPEIWKTLINIGVFCGQFSLVQALRSVQLWHFSPSGGQSIGVSAQESVLHNNIQDWFQTFGHLMQRTDSLEKTCWDRLKAGGEGDDRGWDGWMVSLIQWTWVWVSSRSQWWRGKPGVLQSMESQRVGHNWVTELNWFPLGFTDLISLQPKGLSRVFSNTTVQKHWFFGA